MEMLDISFEPYYLVHFQCFRNMLSPMSTDMVSPKIQCCQGLRTLKTMEMLNMSFEPYYLVYFQRFRNMLSPISMDIVSPKIQCCERL
jgi:hypothetical protein